MGGVLRGRLQRGDHDILDLVHANRGRPARARLVNQSVQAIGDEPTTPLPDRGLRHPQLRRHALVVRPARAGQHDLERNANACADFARRAHETNCAR